MTIGMITVRELLSFVSFSDYPETMCSNLDLHSRRNTMSTAPRSDRRGTEHLKLPADPPGFLTMRGD